MENLANLKLLLDNGDADDKQTNLYVDELRASMSSTETNSSKVPSCIEYLNKVCYICLEDKCSSTEKQHRSNLILAEVIAILRKLSAEVGDNRNNAILIVNNLTENDRFLNRLVDLFVSNVDKVYDVFNESSTVDVVNKTQALIILRLSQFFVNLVNLHSMHFSVYNKSSTIDFKNNYFSKIFELKYLIFVSSLYKCARCSPETSSLLQKSCYAYTAILYNCINDNQLLQNIIFFEDRDVTLWKHLLEHVKYEFSEWSLWIVFIGLKRETFFEYLFVNISSENRCILFDVLFEFIEDECKKQAQTLTPRQISNNMPADFEPISRLQNKILSDSCVNFLFDLFKKEINLIIQNDIESMSSIDSVKISIIRKLSSLLVSLSSMEIYRQNIREDNILLDILANLLNTMQILAKSDPDSVFGVRGRLKDMDQMVDQENNPIYGFKRDIIGLIANVVYQNFNAQEYLRKSNCLAALLDCARVDVNNPFIMQWSIFAIRNALESNSENQQFVAQLQKHGMVTDDLVSQIRS